MEVRSTSTGGRASNSKIESAAGSEGWESIRLCMECHDRHVEILCTYEVGI